MLNYVPVENPRGNRSKTSGWVSWITLLGMPLVWLIPFILLTVIVGLGVGIIFLPLGLGFMAAPVIALFVIYSAYHAVMQMRRQNGRVITSYLDMAVRLNLPLPTLLRAAERSERGVRARQLAALRQSLESGVNVGTSLWELRDISHDTAGRVVAGESLGQLQETLARVVERERVADDEKSERPDMGIGRFYPILMLFFLTTMTGSIMIFVVPKFREIFKDFRTTLPWMTELLVSISTAIADYWPISLLFVLMTFGLVLVMASFYSTRIFLPALPMPRLSKWFERIAWNVPLLHGIQRDRGMSELCESLAVATRDGVPIPAVLKLIGLLPINRGFESQLELFKDGVERGDAVGSAAERAGLPPLFAGMVATVTGTSQATMFEFLARYYRERFSRTLVVLRAAMEPAIVLAFGLIVGFVVLALFLPLTKLIASVAGDPSGGTL